ncbi:hypothetical protein Hdeb2414_s0032g00711811 [Helianthus debilis subsp. tardiflorus]
MALDFEHLATQVKVFVDDLCKTGKLKDVKYTLWNECYTTKAYLDFVNRTY